MGQSWGKLPRPHIHISKYREREDNVEQFLEVIGVSVTTILQAGFLVLVANRIVEGLIKPLFDRFDLDSFWLMYVSWVVGGLLAALGEINLFSAILPAMIWGILPGRVVGIVLTAIAAGGGANLVNDLVDAVTKRGAD